MTDMPATPLAVTYSVPSLPLGVYDPAGIAQQVVGTTATQVLSNKTFVATPSSPVLGAAAQLAQVTADSMIYLSVTTAGTLTVAIGPTAGVANVLSGGLAVGIGLITFRLPAGWFVAVSTSTTATWTAKAITC
jgi:hypothetical protein